MLRALDLAILRWARTCGHTPDRDRWVARFSLLGEHGALWSAMGAVGAIFARGPRGPWLRVTGAVLGAYVLNTALKLIVGRRRPRLPGLPPLVGTPTGLSFPSAHATTSFLAARRLRGLGLPGPPLYALALAMAASRVYLGVHYPSDVAAGAALGTALAGRGRAP